MRLVAVYKTAVLAQIYDLPSGSRVSLSSTSIPVVISVWRMEYELMNPAEAIAMKELSVLKTTSFPPLALAIYFFRAKRTPRPIPIALEAAMA